MNTDDIKIAVIGGDMRYTYTARTLALSGAECAVYGFDAPFAEGSLAVRCKSLDDAVTNADCIVLPMVCTLDGQHVNAPFSKEKINVLDVAKMADCPIFLGKPPSQLKAYCDKAHKSFFDYSLSEELAYLNAIPTAEGAIRTAMENTDEVLHGKRSAILGYGRIGKTLARKLVGLGVRVDVYARKREARACADAVGIQSESMTSLSNKIKEYSFIFNTVPEMMLTSEILDKANKSTLIIDLASAPGGVDTSYAARMGIKTVAALSLPGKYAPVTAGEIIARCVLNTLKEDHD